MSENTPITPITPQVVEPPKPAAPKPMSPMKIALWCVAGLLLASVVVLAAWEQGRVSLCVALNLKGAHRKEADLLVRQKAPVSPAKLFSLYKLEADRKDPLSLWEIGERYQAGNGVGQNDRHARESWEAAAGTGETTCQLRLAAKYEYGDKRTIPANQVKAVELMRMAASQGDASAQERLAAFLQKSAQLADRDLLGFADILSEEQQNGIRALESLAKALRPVAGATAAQLRSDKKAAMADVVGLVRQKLLSESYLWLSILSAHGGGDDVVSRRDMLNSRLGQQELTLAQEAVDRWRTSDSPGSKLSPFARLDGQLLALPDTQKQETLGEMLKALATPDANTEPEVSVTVAKDGNEVGVAAVATPTAVKQETPKAKESDVFSHEATARFITSLKMVQCAAAVQRNAFLTVNYTADGTKDGAPNWSFLSAGFARASARLAAASKEVARRDGIAGADVHSSARVYARDLARTLQGRAACYAAIAQCADQISRNTLPASSFTSTVNLEMQKQDTFLKLMEQAEESMGKSVEQSFGKGLGVSPLDELYKTIAARNETMLRSAVQGLDASKAYALITGIKYDGWTFEFGELRDLRFGAATYGNGVATLPIQVSVVGNATRNSRVIRMTLLLAMEDDRLVLAFLR